MLQRKRGLGPIHPDGHELATFRSADALELGTLLGADAYELVALVHSATECVDSLGDTAPATRAACTPAACTPACRLPYPSIQPGRGANPTQFRPEGPAQVTTSQPP